MAGRPPPLTPQQFQKQIGQATQDNLPSPAFQGTPQPGHPQYNQYMQAVQQYMSMYQYAAMAPGMTPSYPTGMPGSLIGTPTLNTLGDLTSQLDKLNTELKNPNLDAMHLQKIHQMKSYTEHQIMMLTNPQLSSQMMGPPSMMLNRPPGQLNRPFNTPAPTLSSTKRSQATPTCNYIHPFYLSLLICL